MITIVVSENCKNIYNKKEIVSIIETKSDNFSFVYNCVLYILIMAQGLMPAGKQVSRLETSLCMMHKVY